MWCPEGYVLLVEIAYALRRGAYETIGIPQDFLSTPEGRHLSWLAQNGTFLEPFDEAEAYADWLLLSFLTVFESDLRVTLASGVPVRLAEGAISTDMWHDWMEEAMSEDFTKPYDFETYYSFPTSRVDRMKAADYSLEYISRATMTYNSEFLKGAASSVVDGMPLCIKLALVPADHLELVKLVCAKQISRAEGIEATAVTGKTRLSDQIVKAIQAGHVRTKRDAKFHFGAGIKTEAWNATWREVATVVPEASKPGPRGKRTNS